MISIQNLKLLLHDCTFQYIQKFRFRYRFRPKQKYFFGLCIGFGQKEKWLFRLVSVSAEMKKSLSVVPYPKSLNSLKLFDTFVAFQLTVFEHKTIHTHIQSKEMKLSNHCKQGRSS